MSQIDYAFEGNDSLGNHISGYTLLARDDILRIESKVDRCLQTPATMQAYFDLHSEEAQQNVLDRTALINQEQTIALNLNLGNSLRDGMLQITGIVHDSEDRINTHTDECSKEILENCYLILKELREHDSKFDLYKTDLFITGIRLVLKLICSCERALANLCGNKGYYVNTVFMPPFVDASEDESIYLPNNLDYPGVNLAENVNYIRENMQQSDGRIGSILRNTNDLVSATSQISDSVSDLEEKLDERFSASDNHLKTAVEVLLDVHSLNYGAIAKTLSGIDYYYGNQSILEDHGMLYNSELTLGSVCVDFNTNSEGDSSDWYSSVKFESFDPPPELKYGVRHTMVTGDEYKGLQYWLPLEINKYGKFSGVFPDVNKSYFYSEEMGKILAMPWRTPLGNGGSF